MMAKPVYKTVIFGAGQIGQMTARLLSSPCQLLCFADNDPHKHGSYIGNIPVCSPDTAAALLPDLVILGVLDEERRNSMIKQMENLGYHGPFRDPSVLRMFDARVAVMRLLSEQIYQLDIPGNVAELGVFRGEFSSLISAAFPDRKIHLFDTFEGFSEKDITIEASGNLSRAKTGDFSSTDIDSVLHVMPDPTRTVIHKGWFPDTFSDVTDETFCFVSLDADLYAPTAAALPLFYERLATGGVLLIHDVYSTQFSGCKKAVDEFCDVLLPGGRLCIITFHSLEDRIVKEAFARRLDPCTCPKEFPVCVCGNKPDVVKVTGKPIISDKEELERNPRARSAKLRVIEKKR